MIAKSIIWRWKRLKIIGYEEIQIQICQLFQSFHYPNILFLKKGMLNNCSIALYDRKLWTWAIKPVKYE